MQCNTLECTVQRNAWVRTRLNRRTVGVCSSLHSSRLLFSFDQTFNIRFFQFVNAIRCAYKIYQQTRHPHTHTHAASSRSSTHMGLGVHNTIWKKKKKLWNIHINFYLLWKSLLISIIVRHLHCGINRINKIVICTNDIYVACVCARVFSIYCHFRNAHTFIHIHFYL